MPARNVLVTGASRGFGRLIAADLVVRGWRVFATMRDVGARDALDQTVAAAGGVAPSRVVVLPLDVSRPDSIQSAVTQVLARTGGRLDAVVANAGILVAGAFEDTPAEAMRRVIDTNYFGAIETVRAVLPAVRAAHGRIVLMSSDSGLCGTPGLSGYTASKFAVEGWGEALADELRPLGVTVSMIEPGPFKTGIVSAAETYSGEPGGPYARLADLSAAGLTELERSALDGAPVVAAVARALSAGRPRLRYPVGREAKLIIACRGLLPQPVFRRLVARLTGTSRW